MSNATTDHDPAAPCSLETGIDVPSSALMNETREFYTIGMGFKDLGHIEIDIPELNIGPVIVHAIRFGNSTLKLKHNLRADTPEATRATVPSSTHYLTLRVKNIERMVARLMGLQSKPTMLIPPSEATTKQGARVKFAFFMDPVGTQIELVEGRPWVGTMNDDAA